MNNIVAMTLKICNALFDELQMLLLSLKVKKYISEELCNEIISLTEQLLYKLRNMNMEFSYWRFKMDAYGRKSLYTLTGSKIYIKNSYLYLKIGLNTKKYNIQKAPTMFINHNSMLRLGKSCLLGKVYEPDIEKIKSFLQSAW